MNQIDWISSLKMIFVFRSLYDILRFGIFRVQNAQLWNQEFRISSSFSNTALSIHNAELVSMR